MSKLLAPLLLVPALALADIGWWHAGSYRGGVKDVNCRADGGLTCARDAGTAMGQISCTPATAAETGCVSPSAQSWAGNKTFTGNVITPIIDAGVGAIGSLDLRASTITGTATGSTFTLQSNTTDSTTSSTVAAMTFQLGADITNADLGWVWKDSAGNRRLSCTEAGTMNFAAHATDTGASAGTAGTNFSSNLGAGAAGSGATPGATGGSYTMNTGQGGAGTASAGGGSGGFTILASGGGGAASSGGAAGTGGAMSLAAGNGGVSGTSAGGAGGAMTVQSGTGRRGSSGGGAASFTAGGGEAANTTIAPSAGGTVTITAGAGGAADPTQASTAAAGGTVTITSGLGGTGAAGPIAAGAGGALTLKSGGGGTSVGTGAVSGDVTLDTGAATGAANNGAMSIGATSANSITLGRSGKSVSTPGTLATTTTTVSTSITVGASGTALSFSGTTSGAISFGTINAQTCGVATKTLTGATTDGKTTLACQFGSAIENNIVCMCHVSAADTVAFRCCNVTGGNIAVTAGLTFAARAFKEP